jgi:hypothetical protein
LVIFVLLSVVLAFSPALRSQDVGSTFVTGIVVPSDSPNQPVRFCMVTLSGGVGFSQRAAYTGPDGRFEFAGVPTGQRLELKASKGGWLPTFYGALAPGEKGKAIVLGGGQRLDVTLRLFKGAVITGIVRDADGHHVPDSLVSVRTSNAEQGAVSLTDDRGVYRMFGLHPGAYYVSVTVPAAGAGLITIPTARDHSSSVERPTLSQGALSHSYAPVFYPGTSNPSEALPVQVSVGEEIGGIDLTVRVVRTVTVEGSVENASSNVEVQLLLDGPPIPIERTTAPFETATGVRGSFRFLNVPPGRYWIVAREWKARNWLETTGLGVARLEVTDQDIAGVRIGLQLPAKVTGKVTFDGAILAVPKPTSISLVLTETAQLGTSVLRAVMDQFTRSLRTPLRADNSFEFSGVFPGTYSLGLEAPSPWALRSATVAGKDLLDAGLLVDDTSVHGVQVVLEDTESSVHGAVQDALGKPVSDMYVVVFAADPSLWGSERRICLQQVATDGTYDCRGLPAGKYLAAAIPPTERRHLSSSRLSELVAFSVPVGVVSGRATTLNVRLGG